MKSFLKKIVENDAYDILLHPKVLQNYLLFTKEFKEKPLVMKSHPIGVEIEMTNRCNLACIQCLRSQGLKPYKLGDIDPDNYKRILDQFPYVMNISLNGFGEPMMYKHFFDIVAYTRKVRPWSKIGIYTNGILIDEEKAYRMMNSGLTEVDISIDAAYPDTYKRVRRGGRLETLHENIHRLVRIKKETRSKFPLIGVNYVMVNDNEGELVPFVEQAAEFGVDFINCITWAAYDWGFRNRRSRESYLRELESAQKRINELGIRCKSFPEISDRWTDPRKPFSCNFYWGEEFRVTFNGDITLGCCTPFKETFHYGNLLSQDFSEIWNGEAYQTNRRLAKEHIAPTSVCASCDRFCKSFFADQVQNDNGFVSMETLAYSAKKVK